MNLTEKNHFESQIVTVMYIKDIRSYGLEISKHFKSISIQ